MLATMRRFVLFALLLLIATYGCFYPAAALSFTSPPAQVTQGETITIDYSDLPDNAAFTLRIGSRFAVEPGGAFSFEADTFVLPISLQSGLVSAHTENTIWTGLAARMEDVSINVAGDADDEGVFSVEEEQDIPEGTYDYLRLEGEAANSTDEVTADLRLTGTKQGADDGRISFFIGGIESGEVTVTILVDGAEQLQSSVIIGNGTVSSSTPSTNETSAEDSPLQAWQTPKSSAEDEDHDEGLQTITSPDGRAALIGVSDKNVEIIETNIENIPEDWIAISTGYAVIPPETTFSPAATLAIGIPDTVFENLSQYNLFLARYNGNAWQMLQSRIENDTAAAQISTGGTYCLMSLKPETKAAQEGTRASPLTPAAPAPTASLPPGYPWYAAALALTAAIILMGYLRRRR